MKRRHPHLRRSAIHEAGHAVIGRVLKQVCGQATIKPNFRKGEGGHVITNDPHGTLGHWLDDLQRWRGDDPMPSIMRGRIMATMAGGEAEAEFFGSCAGGDSDDRHQVDLMLDSLLPANADLPRYAQRFRRHTQALVRRHRATIERVAGQLLKRTTLKAEEIDAIIAGE